MAGCASFTLQASSEETPSADEGFTFVSLDEILPIGGIKVHNGKEVDLQNWKSIAVSLTPSETCTASLVGSQVILTSAHCVDADSLAAEFRVSLGKVRFGGRAIDMIECTVSDSYKSAKSGFPFPRSAQDYALCRLAVPVDDSVQPEVISIDLLGRSDHVLLMGFGCKEIQFQACKQNVVRDPKGDEKLRIGDQSIAAIDAEIPGGVAGFLKTTSNGEKPGICPGDSGGPAMVGISESSLKQERRISAINAAFVPQCFLGSSPSLDSYLTPLDSSFETWARSWSNQRGLKICGMQLPAGVGGCRP